LLMTDVLACAVRLLARREHSLAELTDKLAQRGYPREDIQKVVENCQQQGLQSDVRFAESLVRTRVRQGYGPVRIRQELQAKQVSRSLIDGALRSEQDNWISHATCAWKKKYKPSGDESFAEKQKQKQFLLYRGFSADMIAKVV